MTAELGRAFETMVASEMKRPWAPGRIAPQKAAVLQQVSELEELDQEQACDPEPLIELEKASGWSLPVQASESRWAAAQEPASEMGSVEPQQGSELQGSEKEPAFGMQRHGHLEYLAED